MSPITQIFTRCRSDPSKGYLIRTYRGDNIAAILQAEMQAEPNADIA